MNILVTGGCGLIGSHVAAYYKEQGHEVYVIDNFERSRLLGHEEVSSERVMFNKNRLEKLGVHIIRGDVSDFNVFGNCVKFDGIFHMAAQCGVPTSIADPMRDFEVNAVGTLNMLEKARRDEAVVIYASTNKVYPILGDNWWHKEDNRWRWSVGATHEHGWSPTRMPSTGSRTPYGTSKYAGDLYCQEYAKYYGVRTGVFRMSCIYGDHQFGFEEQGWAAWFVIAALKGYPLLVFGDGCQVRDMLYVSDVVKAYDAYFQKALKSKAPYSLVCNLGGGPSNTLSINECIDFLDKRLRADKEWATGYHDWRPSDQKVYTSDISLVKEELGWEPTIKPEEGLIKVINWAKQHLDLF